MELARALARVAPEFMAAEGDARPAATSAPASWWGALTAFLRGPHLAFKFSLAAAALIPMIGGTLTTAGNLVFAGEGNGYFNAYNATTGEKLWSFQAGAGVNSAPMSFTLDGKQYIAVAAGGNFQLNYKLGDSLLVFALD